MTLQLKSTLALSWTKPKVSNLGRGGGSDVILSHIDWASLTAVSPARQVVKRRAVVGLPLFFFWQGGDGGNDTAALAAESAAVNTTIMSRRKL